MLMGGMSIEKEVSFNSGRTICDHLNTQLYEVIPLFQTVTNKLYILPMRFLYRGKISDFEHRLTTQAQEIVWDDLKNIIDFMYLSLHGRFAEDGTVQGFLEVLGIPYLGTKVLGSALGIDKVFQRKLLQAASVAIPHGLTFSPDQVMAFQQHVEPLVAVLYQAQLNFPVVVKPACEGSSLGVSVVGTIDQLVNALQYASTISPHGMQSVVVEEHIEGMEFTCIVLLDPVTQEPCFLPPTEILKEKGFAIHGYEQKYMPGRSQKFTPARCSDAITKRIQESCLRVMKALHFSTVARIDGFVKPDGSVIIIDPNTIVGMAPSSFFFNQAAEMGMNHAAIINYLISSELRGYGMQTVEHEEAIHMADIKKIRVGVLLGGASNEKETSLESGRNVCYKLSSHKYAVTPLFVDTKMELYPLNQRLLVHNATIEIECDIDRSTKMAWSVLPEHFDFIFIALHGGAGENGAVQGTLELLGIAYNGSSIAASALAMNKYETNNFLVSQGFEVPKNYLIAAYQWRMDQASVLATLQTLFTFPVIVKPHDDGCSVMVQKVDTSIECVQAIDLLFAHGKQYAFIEEYIVGMELTVGVVGNKNPQALPPSQAVTARAILTMEEKFLPGAGENQTPALLPQEALQHVQEVVAQAFKVIGCVGYARIDCFYQSAMQSQTGKERVVILEINSLPALTPATCLFHQAAEMGMSPRELIEKIIELGFEKHAKVNVAISKELEI